MTLPLASNTIRMDQVNTELGLSSTAMITLNDTAVRNLFGKPSGTISMSDGWGKSAFTFAFNDGSLYAEADQVNEYSSSTISINPNGSITYSSTGAGSTAWGTPQSSGLGGGYQVRVRWISKAGAGGPTFNLGGSYSTPSVNVWTAWTSLSSYCDILETSNSSGGYCNGEVEIRNASTLATIATTFSIQITPY